MYSPHKQYAVYFPNGGQVRLRLPTEKGRKYVYYWMDIARTKISPAEGIAVEVEQGTINLSTPSKGHWAAIVTSEWYALSPR